jgi:hypothetical protein
MDCISQENKKAFILTRGKPKFSLLSMVSMRKKIVLQNKARQEKRKMSFYKRKKANLFNSFIQARKNAKEITTQERKRRIPNQILGNQRDFR